MFKIWYTDLMKTYKHGIGFLVAIALFWQSIPTSFAQAPGCPSPLANPGTDYASCRQSGVDAASCRACWPPGTARPSQSSFTVQTPSGPVPINVSGSSSPMGEFLGYLALFLEWIISVGVGIAVFWVVVSGIMIMVGKSEQGKTHMFWAIGGVIGLLLISMVLRMLNSIFFV